MSQENLEIVRGILAEFGETRQPTPETSPDFIWSTGSWPAWTGPSEYRGADGFLQFFGEWTAAYEEWAQEIEEILDAGGNQVVVITRQRGRLRNSDSWVDLQTGFVYTIEDGLLVRGDVHESRAEALKAVGLQE